MATIALQSATLNGAFTYSSAAAGGDTLALGAERRAAFLVRNGGSSITVTLTGVQVCSQGVTHNVVVTCPAGDNVILIPGNVINATTGNVGVTYSAVTSVTIAVITDH